jgi:hypothetical protein
LERFLCLFTECSLFSERMFFFVRCFERVFIPFALNWESAHPIFFSDKGLLFRFTISREGNMAKG